MEKLWGYLAAVGVVIVIVALGASCGKPTPTPPGPGPVPNPQTDFTAQGRHVRIDGRLKPGAAVTVDEAKRSLQTAADFIDKQ